MLDSSLLIAVERAVPAAERFLAENLEGEVQIAAITASELLHGVHRAANAAQRRRREVFVEQILAAVPIVPFDLVAARLHARLAAELGADGVSVGAHDLIIGATALAQGAAVATRDRRSFPRIPGLDVILA